MPHNDRTAIDSRPGTSRSSRLVGPPTSLSRNRGGSGQLTRAGLATMFGLLSGFPGLGLITALPDVVGGERQRAGASFAATRDARDTASPVGSRPPATLAGPAAAAAVPPILAESATARQARLLRRGRASIITSGRGVEGAPTVRRPLATGGTLG